MSLTVRRRPAALVSLLVLTFSLGCPHKPAERTKVVVSIFPVYDLTRRIAGPDADVTLILPQGKSVQGFVPPDPAAATAARLGVMVGLGLDPWMDGLMKAAPKAHVLKVADRVPTLGRPLPGAAAGANPYVWLDPQRAAVMSKAIAEELGRVDSAHALAYRARADRLGDALDALDKEVDAKAATWKTRSIVTLHDDFGYFADRYHLRVAAVVELAPDTWKSAGAPLVMLDPLGAVSGIDSYEKLIRLDVAALDQALR